MSSGRRIEKLAVSHGIDSFVSGQEALDRYLRLHAWRNQKAEAAQTYLMLDDAQVLGYYSLAASHIFFDDAPERLRKGLARHPVPLMLLARLAVDRRWQKKGVGAALLKDALLRTLQVAEI